MDNNATARCHKLAIFYISTITGTGLDVLQVHTAHSVVSESEEHGSIWVNVKGMTSLGKTELYNIVNLTPIPYFRV